MVAVSMGDMARYMLLEQQSLRHKSKLNVLASELASHRKADIGASTGGNFLELSGLTASIGYLEAWQKTTARQLSRAEAMQSVLSGLHSEAESFGTDLLMAGETTTSVQDQFLAEEGAKNLARMVGMINTALGGESLFSGVRKDAQALASADQLLIALKLEVVGLDSAEEINAAVQGWFDDPAGFAAQIYQGGEKQGFVRVSATQLSRIAITAEAVPLRDTLAAVALAALAAEPLKLGQDQLGKDLLAEAASRLRNGAPDRISLAAELGREEEHLAGLQSRQSAELSTLKVRVADITQVDQYETIANIEATRLQIEVLFGLMARLSELTLVKYL